MSWSAALHRSAAPHPPEFARSAQEAPTKPTKHELFAALVSGLDEITTDADWKRTFLTEAVAVATSDAAMLRSSSALDGKVRRADAVMCHGSTSSLPSKPVLAVHRRRERLPRCAWCQPLALGLIMSMASITTHCATKHTTPRRIILR